MPGRLVPMPRLPHLPEEGPVPSPCVSVCRMDVGTGWCEGCSRNIDEIAAWSVLSDIEKRAIWSELERRRAALAALAALDTSNGWLTPEDGL